MFCRIEFYPIFEFDKQWIELYKLPALMPAYFCTIKF